MKLRRSKRKSQPEMTEAPSALTPAVGTTVEQAPPRRGLRRSAADHTIDIVRGSAVERLRSGRAAVTDQATETDTVVDLTAAEAAPPAPVAAVERVPTIAMIDLTDGAMAGQSAPTNEPELAAEIAAPTTDRDQPAYPSVSVVVTDDAPAPLVPSLD